MTKTVNLLDVSNVRNFKDINQYKNLFPEKYYELFIKKLFDKVYEEFDSDFIDKLYFEFEDDNQICTLFNNSSILRLHLHNNEDTLLEKAENTINEMINMFKRNMELYHI